MVNQSLFQYKQYVKEHAKTKNNHIFVKYLIEQDKQEVGQLHLIHYENKLILNTIISCKRFRDNKNNWMINKTEVKKNVELSDKQLDDLESKFNKLTTQINSLQQEKKLQQLKINIQRINQNNGQWMEMIQCQKQEQ